MGRCHAFTLVEVVSTRRFGISCFEDLVGDSGYALPRETFAEDNTASDGIHQLRGKERIVFDSDGDATAG